MDSRNLLDDINDFFNPPPPPRATPTPRRGNTVVAVTTMTAPKTDGEAVFVTPGDDGDVLVGDPIAGGAVFATRTRAAPSGAIETSPAEPTDDSQNAPVAPVPPPNLPPTFAGNSPINTSSLANSGANPGATEPQNAGLSGGAKAGIAFGVLIPLGALLIVALIFLRRKKQKKEMGEKMDNEKTTPMTQSPDSLPAFAAPTPAPVAMGAIANRSQDTLNAPRLELRPQTQFDPRMSKLSGPGNGAMAAGAVGAAAAVGLAGAAAAKRSESPAWDRRGNERNANDPANPFGNHAAYAAANSPRAPSPNHIEPSDFPLPGSKAASERAISLMPTQSVDNLSMAPSNPATVSNLSLIAPSAPGPNVGMGPGGIAAGVAAGAAAGAAMAAGRPPSPPSPAAADNVYRVQLDFKPSMEDELDIRAGQLVRILHAYDDGWALCTRMDRSQQGVVPRSCLSKNSVKPRPGPPPQGRPNGAPGPRGPPGPQMRPYSPGPGPQAGRPMTPQGGRNSPAPFAQAPRPMTPTGPPMGAPGPMQAPPQAPYQAYTPQRSQSPGPYGPPCLMKPPSRPDEASRPRANSLGGGSAPTGPLKPLSPVSQIPIRKPVPGMAV